MFDDQSHFSGGGDGAASDPVAVAVVLSRAVDAIHLGHLGDERAFVGVCQDLEDELDISVGGVRFYADGFIFREIFQHGGIHLIDAQRFNRLAHEFLERSDGTLEFQQTRRA